MNIFKTFKENKYLLEENKRLKAQNDALVEFKINFDKFYHDISDVKFIERSRGNIVGLTETLTLDDTSIYYSVDRFKETIVRHISKQLMPYIEFDIVDNEAYGTKDLIGRLFVVTK